MLKKGFYKLEDLNGTEIRDTLHKNWLKWFYIWDPEEIKPEDYINKNSCSIKEAFIKEKTLKEEAIV